MLIRIGIWRLVNPDSNPDNTCQFPGPDPAKWIRPDPDKWCTVNGARESDDSGPLLEHGAIQLHHNGAGSKAGARGGELARLL